MSTFTLIASTHLAITVNLLAALVLGATIGLERQFNQRYTGVATHALVALGAAAFTSIPDLVGPGGEPTRIASQVVTGIGFLGAGLIFREGASVHGLSAAASIWGTGAVGALCGFGFLVEAVEVALMMFAANLLLPRIGGFIDRFASRKAGPVHAYVIELSCRAGDEITVRARLIQEIATSKLRLRGVASRPGLEHETVVIEAIVHAGPGDEAVVERIVRDLGLSQYVAAARWRLTNTDD